MNGATRSSGRTAMLVLGWGWIVVSVVVLLVFGSVRMIEMESVPNPNDSFALRYVEHPVVAYGHMVPGLLFLVFAPLQFVSRIRRNYIRVHRWSGRVLVVLAAASGIYALVAAFVLPAFGGFITQAATVVFGALFMGSLWMAVKSIRRRRVAEHREWMIRVFAIGLAVATIRAAVGILQAVTGGTLEDVFGASFWIGFSLNVVVAELWIRATRVRPASNAPRTAKAVA